MALLRSLDGNPSTSDFCAPLDPIEIAESILNRDFDNATVGNKEVQNCPLLFALAFATGLSVFSSPNEALSNTDGMRGAMFGFNCLFDTTTTFRPDLPGSRFDYLEDWSFIHGFSDNEPVKQKKNAYG